MTFFEISKVFWIVLAPGTILVLSLSLGVILQAFTRCRRLGFGMVACSAATMLLLMWIPLGDWLLRPLENRFPALLDPPARVDGIIVLGGMIDPGVSRLRGKVMLLDPAERLTETVLLARRFPTANIVVSGGNGNLRGGPTEARYMREFLIQQGVEAGRIITENKSRNTAENARYSLAAVTPKPDQTWLLVTSAAHMPRAVACFEALGWRVTAVPVDYRTPGSRGFSVGQIDQLDSAAKEWIGLIAYRLAGRTKYLFPGPRDAS